MPRLVLLSYFEPNDLPTLLRQVERAALPVSVPVYVGSYGSNAGLARQVAAAPGGRYAPTLARDEEYYRERRRLPPDQEAQLPKRFAGAVPPFGSLASTAERVSWGVEVGQRFRDVIRATEDTGAVVDAWQLDEIGPSAARAAAQPQREFIRGILRGLLYGRPILGDRTMQGFVWVAHSALPLAQLPITPELTTFWRTLNGAALGYVGEEYPRFEGDPRAVARLQASGQRALAAGGPVRQAVGRKYVAGMTPGYHLEPDLGGNVHGWPRPQVNAWRTAYVQERAGSGVAGVGEFDFRFGNSTVTVMHDTLSSLASSF